MEKWNTINFAAELSHKGINRMFKPPTAPHQGGAWERPILSFKRILQTILSIRCLNHEVLSTALCIVEYALNAHPLTPVCADPIDLGTITPNHFLLGNQATAFPSIVGVEKFYHRKRYAVAQSNANANWSRRLKSTYR